MANQYNSELLDFAIIPFYHAAFKFLAEELTQSEEWDYSGTVNKKHSILKNYMEFTFRRLKRETKIAFTNDNKYSCFNTGLVTDRMEDIYAFFEKHRNPKPGDSQFVFQAFLKESDSTLLSKFHGNTPEVANYFEKPEELIFNPKSKLIPDIDHIIGDNIDRFPKHLQTADDSEVRRQLVGAIDEIKKRVRNNYKIAVPQYYDGKIQLLLPLCLTAGSPNPDLALVVNRINGEMYSSRTCLTLKMAYGNARLIVKPESNWLRP